MTDIEKLEHKIELLQKEIDTHNQKIEGYTDTFTVAINDIKENQNKFFSLIGIIFSALGILLIGIQIGLALFKN